MNEIKTDPIHLRSTVRHANNHPKGFTIIELLIVLAVTSSVLGGTIGLISIAQGSNQQSKQNLFQRQEIRRFADDMRRDIRRAESSTLSDGKLVLLDTSLDREVAYQVESDSVVRRSEENIEARSVARDGYNIGISARITVQWLDEINAAQWTITENERLVQPIHIIASHRTTQ